MILPKTRTTITALLFLFLLSSGFSQGFTKVEKEFVYKNQSLNLKLDERGDLISYVLRGKHYERDFISKELKSPESEEIVAPEWLSSLCGIRFGIPHPGRNPFSVISSEIDAEQPSTLRISLEDRDKDSPGYGLKLHKTWMISKEKNQLSLELKVENPLGKTISLFPSSNVNKTLGMIFSIRGGVEYWDTFIAGSRDEIDEYQGDLEEGFGAVGVLDDPSRVFIAYRNQHFVAGMMIDEPHALYGRKNYIENTNEALYTAFLPIGKDFLKGGESVQRIYRFYIGEKTEAAMAQTAFAPLFDKYGEILGGIERLLFQTLKLFYTVTHNYGWAILCLTLLVKLILLPLNIKQTRSMAKMQEVQPELKKLQEKYKDDRQKLNAEMMKLYQANQINPVAGCFPMLLQLPIFFALFYTVGGSVEIYGESFYWIKNLALRDPTDILPLIFVGSFMISQRKMSADPNQKMLIYVLPVVFFFMMRNLSAGVMLYIVGQSLFSNVEQMIIKGKTSPAVQEQETNSAKRTGGKKRKKKKKTKDGQQRWHQGENVSKNRTEQKRA